MNTQTIHEPKKYAMTLTYLCNWNCDYCAVRNSVDWKPVVTREDVLKKISCIENGSDVTLFGGEPGMLPKHQLVEYIDILKSKKCRLFLETNGLFIRNYPELLPEFKHVMYHCSMNLDEDDKIDIVDDVETTYMLIVHDENIDRLSRFLEMHQEPEKFYIVEATYPHEKTGPTLSKTNKNRLLTRFFKRMTRDAIKRLINGFDFNRIIFLT